jgi:protein SCO1
LRSPFWQFKAGSKMNRIIVPYLACLLLPLSACQPAGEAQAPLTGAKMGGPFSLINQNGKRMSERDFAGKYRLIYFGYTFCPDVCPTDVQKLMQGYRALEQSDKAKADRLQPIFISVDPARDTPPALKQFVSSFHPKLIGLTGSEAEVDKVAKAYGVYFERGTPNAQGVYLVNHSSNAVLYGPQGQPIAIIPQDKDAEAIAAELARWIR